MNVKETGVSMYSSYSAGNKTEVNLYKNILEIINNDGLFNNSLAEDLAEKIVDYVTGVFLMNDKDNIKPGVPTISEPEPEEKKSLYEKISHIIKNIHIDELSEDDVINDEYFLISKEKIYTTAEGYILKITFQNFYKNDLILYDKLEAEKKYVFDRSYFINIERIDMNE